MLSRLLSGISQKISFSAMSLITKEAGSSMVHCSAVPNTLDIFWNATSVRTKIRYYFPNPNERKRVKKQGWLARMSTLGGRKILMRRILKGRHVLCH